jgi:glycerol-3-phosphate acyltransferase PlsY
MIVELVILLIGAYILGSVPFGVLIARAKGVDIMQVGSGNIGATNVNRALGTGPALLVFFLDALKGLLPALAARFWLPEHQEMWLLTGAMAIVGHSFSPFLRFRGGKGIATALGMVIGASPLIAAGAFLVFAALLATTRYMSLASMISVASTIPLGIALHESTWMIGGYLVLTMLISWRHRANIRRLRNGSEPKFAFKKTKLPQTEGRSGAESKPVKVSERVEGDEEQPADAS